MCLDFATSLRASRAQWLALALVSGGGIGNWLDRVLHDGAVTDFVSIGVGSLRTGVFNLADLAVVAGVCLLLVSTGHAAEEPGELASAACPARPSAHRDPGTRGSSSHAAGRPN